MLTVLMYREFQAALLAVLCLIQRNSLSAELDLSLNKVKIVSLLGVLISGGVIFVV